MLTTHTLELIIFVTIKKRERIFVDISIIEFRVYYHLIAKNKKGKLENTFVRISKCDLVLTSFSPSAYNF